MTLKFYMVPGSCSTGIHILREALDLPFEVSVLNMPAGDHRRPAFNGKRGAVVCRVPGRQTGLALPPRGAAHYQRVRARPVVQQVLREESYR